MDVDSVRFERIDGYFHLKNLINILGRTKRNGHISKWYCFRKVDFGFDDNYFDPMTVSKTNRHYSISCHHV